MHKAVMLSRPASIAVVILDATPSNASATEKRRIPYVG
jgi:hypothetical protein